MAYAEKSGMAEVMSIGLQGSKWGVSTRLMRLSIEPVVKLSILSLRQSAFYGNDIQMLNQFWRFCMSCGFIAGERLIFFGCGFWLRCGKRERFQA